MELVEEAVELEERVDVGVGAQADGGVVGQVVEERVRAVECVVAERRVEALRVEPVRGGGRR
ncbi:hypothetical protein ACFQH6_16015 [Halobacteriaceae archaeon GCM10025711]